MYILLLAACAWPQSLLGFYKRVLVKCFSADRAKCFSIFKAMLDGVQMWKLKAKVLCEKALSAIVSRFFCLQGSHG